MRRRIGWSGAGVSMALGLTPVIADAEVLKQPGFEAVKLDPGFADLDRTSVRLSGRLVVRGASGAVEPVSFATVQVVCDGVDVGGEYNFTDDQGWFYFDYFWVRAPRNCGLRSLPSQTLAGAEAAVDVPVRRQQLRVVSNGPAPRAQVGRAVAVVGRVQRQGRSGWADLGGPSVWVEFYESNGRRLVGGVFPADDGVFRSTVKSTGLGPITAKASCQAWCDPSAPVLVVRTPWRTELGRLASIAPQYPFRGRNATITDTLRTVAGKPVAGQRVFLQIKPGKGSWRTAASALSDSRGRVRFAHRVLGDFSWRTVFKGGPGFVTARSGGQQVSTYVQTAIAEFNASPEPVGKGRQITLRGRLMRWTAKSGWRPITDKRIDGAFRPKGSKRWIDDSRFCTGAITDSKGWFRVECLATRDATWMAYFLWKYPGPYPRKLDFPAQAYDYVDVR